MVIKFALCVKIGVISLPFLAKEPNQAKSNPLPDPVTTQSNNLRVENHNTTAPVDETTDKNGNRTESIENRVELVEDKPSKNVTDVFRDIDEKKIQSNTKDIEDESGNILQTRRVQIATTTTASPSRSTLPNTFSDAGGNGGTLENVQTLGSDSVVPKRHRRRRSGRCVLCVLVAVSCSNW